MTCYRIAAASAALAAAIGFGVGRWSAPDPPALVEDTLQSKEAEKIAWQKTDAVSAKVDTATAQQQRVRVVTRWLRPDGTPSREQVTESGQQTTSRTVSAAVASGSERATADRTVEVVRTVTVDLRPRWHLQAMGGLDLSWRRHWGAQLSVRGPAGTTLGVWTLPSARAAGVSLGLTF